MVDYVREHCGFMSDVDYIDFRRFDSDLERVVELLINPDTTLFVDVCLTDASIPPFEYYNEYNDPRRHVSELLPRFEGVRRIEFSFEREERDSRLVRGQRAADLDAFVRNAGFTA